MTGAQTGVRVESSPSFKAQADWFGVKLDGSADANGTGIFLGPESDNGRIGGEGPEAGNVIAGNSGDGLDIHGARGTKVLGDYFGVKRDGTTQLANGKDIEVTSVSEGGPEASGTAIGTKVSQKAAATPKCDGGCNLISGSASSGIDLEGDGGAEAPAVTTTVAGNFIGLNAGGTAAIPNASSDVLVGQAAQTVIGGPRVGEANRINGGSAAILAGPAAPDLVVRGNLIGLDAAGTVILAPPDEGIVVDSEGLASLAVEAVVADNEIGLEGGVAIDQEGLGATIAGNRIRGAADGIWTHGLAGGHGNLIEGNSIEELEGSGILVESDLNEIFGNEILGAGVAGIWVKGSLPLGITQNLVGGDTTTSENVIAGAGGDAIEISDVEATENEVARNRGFANNGLFIHLVAAGAEPKGPNKGIKPPAFASATQASASGGGAEPGAEVRVFRKQLAAAGEVHSFLGEATADGGGNWKVVYGEAVPAGTIVAATQTSEAGGTSELATTTTAVEPGGEGGAGGGGQPGNGVSSAGDRTPPQTKIAKGPRRRSRGDAARFEFRSDEPGSTFQCRLDRKPFRPCESPRSYQGLRPGKHLFEVRAVDPAGNVDSSPARQRFTILAGGKGKTR
ncbi:MAG: right-handed parallel beta-helix repeat-containing protein [Mycobacteriales bacterium]